MLQKKIDKKIKKQYNKSMIVGFWISLFCLMMSLGVGITWSLINDSDTGSMVSLAVFCVGLFFTIFFGYYAKF